MGKETCIFCDREKIQQDIIHETPNFFFKVGFGLVTPGHTMIISKRHYSCFGEIPHELDSEYEESKNLLTKKISEEFSEPFLFEAGAWGQSVEHAHTHLIPSEGEGYKIQSILEEMVLPGKPNIEEADLRRLKEIFRQEGGYVSFEEHGKLYVCHIQGIEFDYGDFNPFLSYRGFFDKKVGLKGQKGWKNLTDQEKQEDNRKRDLTKRVLTF